jgi:hypothetical protein
MPKSSKTMKMTKTPKSKRSKKLTTWRNGRHE